MERGIEKEKGGGEDIGGNFVHEATPRTSRGVSITLLKFHTLGIAQKCNVEDFLLVFCTHPLRNSF